MYPEWFLTKNRPKNRRENRGERRERSFGRFHSGELRRIYPGAVDLSGERKELHDFRRRHFSRISMGMWEKLRNRTKQTQKWPKKWYFGHFLPLGGLKDPPEVPIEVETCRTINGTYFEGISSPKNWTGLAGGVRNQFWGLKTTKSEKIWSLVATCSEGPLRSI